MKVGPLVAALSGTIVADETFIGGKPKNRHQSRKGKYGAGARSGLKPKTAVLSLISTQTGEARSRVIPNVTGATLRDALTEVVDTASSTLHTDKWGGYVEVGKKFVGGHESVDHSGGEYVRGSVSTNQAENFFSQ